MNPTLEQINEELKKRNIDPLPEPQFERKMPEPGHLCISSQRSFTKDDQDFAALQARIMLIGGKIIRGIYIPDYNEWVGVNVLERDGGLPK